MHADDLVQRLREAASSIPKTRKELAEELDVKLVDVVRVVGPLVRDGLLEEIEDRPEPRFRARVNTAFLEQLEKEE